MNGLLSNIQGTEDFEKKLAGKRVVMLRKYQQQIKVELQPKSNLENH